MTTHSRHDNHPIGIFEAALYLLTRYRWSPVNARYESILNQDECANSVTLRALASALLSLGAAVIAIFATPHAPLAGMYVALVFAVAAVALLITTFRG